HAPSPLPVQCVRFAGSRRHIPCRTSCPLFFFNDTATPEIYTLSLHDALPISAVRHAREALSGGRDEATALALGGFVVGMLDRDRSEEHTSELQSLTNLVCRLLLEKKKKECTTSDTTDTSKANRMQG